MAAAIAVFAAVVTVDFEAAVVEVFEGDEEGATAAAVAVLVEVNKISLF